MSSILLTSLQPGRSCCRGSSTRSCSRHWRWRSGWLSLSRGHLARLQGQGRCVGSSNEYIELIRDTPFLIQIFVIYFGLPSMGLKLSSNVAALLALVVNVGAYGIEIIRAGIESIHKGQVETGKSLGMGPLKIFQYIFLKPALQAIYPSFHQR